MIQRLTLIPRTGNPRHFSHTFLNSLLDEYERAYTTEKIGQHFRVGGHGRYNEDWEVLLDSSVQYVLEKKEAVVLTFSSLRRSVTVVGE